MTFTRRNTILMGAAGMLAACSGGALHLPPAGETWRTEPNPGFDAWVAAFRPRAQAQGISAATLDRAFRGAGYLPGVIERDRNQTEFTRTLEDYLSIAASDERISKGRAAFQRHNATLQAIESRYGVDAPIVAAVWGLESRYGERRGDAPVISAVSTLAYDGRRGSFFESQLIAALKILQSADTTPERMTGSWAGAMGHTQFIPTSYLAYAVDFDGDGRRDIWSDDPTDALASTAAYLRRSGWTRGQPWGIEVALPEGFNPALAGRGTTRGTSAWAGMGVRPVAGGSLPDHGAGSILMPMGARGPAFLVFRNFTVITRYNNAENYVIGVGHLSDRIRGAGPLQARFPPDRHGLTKDDRIALQRRLNAAGFDAGDADGVIGAKTQEAIRAWQRRNGIAVTGEPSRELLAQLG
ncbi:lytic murein transglycosylase [Pontibaca methylaminivorans]|uniref:lytic murein transglycosylase n=1 Tax=Pontibaca methylaminivorans TaxID=515897 RepID=UPI002FDB1C5B